MSDIKSQTAPRTAGNIDKATVASFGDEWSRFDQTALDEVEVLKMFNEYFAIFPWSALAQNAVGFDMGCGSGRWARLVAPRVGHLHCVDPSDALEVAKRALAIYPNVTFHRGSVDDGVLPPESQDFGYSLGVLHHIPDTAAGIKSCVALLKPGAPFLLYLYYALDNRSAAFRLLWRCSDALRRVISASPAGLKRMASDALALSVYYPLARGALLAERLGLSSENIPLSHYRHHSLYTMRTDARDRFGTPLESRFSQNEIRVMMEEAGLGAIRFSERPPFWCGVGVKK